MRKVANIPVAQLVGGLYGADKAQAEGDNSMIVPAAAALGALPVGTLVRDRMSQHMSQLAPINTWPDYTGMPASMSFAEASKHPDKALAREYWANQKVRKYAPAVGGAATSFLAAYLLQSLFGRDAKSKPAAPVSGPPPADAKKAAAYAATSRAHNKRAFLDELKDTWGKMDTGSKVTTGAGAALALASLINQFRPRNEDDEPNTLLNALGGIGGLGAAAYGLSGNDLGNILPALSKITGIGGGNSTTPAPAAPAAPAAPKTDWMGKGVVLGTAGLGGYAGARAGRASGSRLASGSSGIRNRTVLGGIGGALAAGTVAELLRRWATK